MSQRAALSGLMNRVPEIVYRVLNRGGHCQGEDRCCEVRWRGLGSGLSCKGRVPALSMSATQGARASVTQGPPGRAGASGGLEGLVLVGQGGSGLGRLIYNLKQCEPRPCTWALFWEGVGFSRSTGLW